MSNDAKKGPLHAKNDHERAKLRGKGHRPETGAATHSGVEFAGEMPGRTDAFSLQGIDTPEHGAQAARERYHPQGQAPQPHEPRPGSDACDPWDH